MLRLPQRSLSTAGTMAVEDVEQIADKQAAAIRKADQEASKKADPKARTEVRTLLQQKKLW